jgi:hypothetical protein
MKLSFKTWLERHESKLMKNAPGSKKSKLKRLKLAGYPTPETNVRPSRVYT